MGGFISEKCWLNTKIPIFWRFWPQNLTFYCPTLVMNCKKSLFFFIFPIVPYTFCCLKVIFWWFGRIYWGKILIKYQNSYILTILAPKYWPSTALPWVLIAKKSLFFFTFLIVSYILCYLKVIFLWFGGIYWEEILIKYQNTYILTNLASKCDFLPPYTRHELKKNHFFYFSNSSPFWGQNCQNIGILVFNQNFSPINLPKPPKNHI